MKKATSPRPGNRWSSCQEFVKRLREAVKADIGHSRTNTPPKPPASTRHLGHYKEDDEPVPGYKLIRELGAGQFGVVWERAGAWPDASRR